MNVDWQNSFVKLIAGGCGTQLGLLFSCGGMAALISLCVVCSMTNVVSFGLTQEAANLPLLNTFVNTPAAPPSETTNVLETNPVGILQETLSPPAPLVPVALVHEGGVNLRSGPGMEYEKVGTLPVGASMEIIGRNLDSTWWLVSTADYLFVWVADTSVDTKNVDDTVAIVAIPAQVIELTPQASTANAFTPAEDSAASTSGTNSETGTLPIDSSGTGHLFVEDTAGYKQLGRKLLIPPVSASISPDQTQIAMTEGIKLYIISLDGNSEKIVFESSAEVGLIREVVWSPDGRHLAFTAERKLDCQPGCEVVGLVSVAEAQTIFLTPPSSSVVERPRWTVDGQLLVTAHPGNINRGRAFVYDLSGQGQVAEGSFALSSSHTGQQWLPWIPGRTWTADGTDTYYAE